MIASVVAIDFVKRYRIVVSSGKIIDIYLSFGETKVVPSSPIVDWEEKEALNLVWSKIREGK